MIPHPATVDHGKSPVIPPRPDPAAAPPAPTAATPSWPACPADPKPRRSGLAYYRRADHLADWAIEVLIVRTDCWGGYTTRVDGRTGDDVVGPTTRFRDPDPAKERTWSAGPLDHELLARHFMGLHGLGGMVGLHCTAPAEWCRWVVVDIDVHDEGDDPGAVGRMGATVVAELARLGLPYRVESSNGKGGLHIWILLGCRVPMADAYRLGRFLIRDWATSGLTGPPETFPKAARLIGARCGNWVRLPGLHHKREYWSMFLSAGGDRWLSGDEAIDHLVSFRPDPSVDPMASVPADFVAASVAKKAVTAARRARPAGSSAGMAATVEGDSPDLARARAALAHLGPEWISDFENWRMAGMALTGYGDDGLELWDDASAADEGGYPGRYAIEDRWAGFEEGGVEGRVGIGSLLRAADEEGWDHKIPAIRGARKRRPGLLRRLEADGASGVTPAMSRGWDRELDRPAAVLDARDDLRVELATRLGLSEAGLDVVSASIRFGFKQTNQETKSGKREDLGSCFVWPERDGAGRTVGLRRIFAAGVADPERAAGPREGLVARRGLLSNLATPGLQDGPIYLVRGLLDFAAAAARRLPVVGLPAGIQDRRDSLEDLKALVAGDPRPVALIIRQGADAQAAAEALADLLGRVAGVSVVTRPFPEKFASLHQYCTTLAKESGAR
jgi:TOTE conflict system, Archaeo-Eukaryotic Primase domain/Primase C terminal 2 (PriCT-2)